MQSGELDALNRKAHAGSLMGQMSKSGSAITEQATFLVAAEIRKTSNSSILLHKKCRETLLLGMGPLYRRFKALHQFRQKHVKISCSYLKRSSLCIFSFTYISLWAEIKVAFHGGF